MIKLLVDSPQGIQRIEEVEESGSYFDETRVLWDERKQGPIPKELLANVGSLAIKDGKLEEDQARKKVHDDALALEKKPEEDRKKLIADIKAIKDKPSKSPKDFEDIILLIAEHVL